MTGLTEEKQSKIMDYGMSRPIPLEDANLKRSFLYDRVFGFFYIDSGNHQLAMALLYSWHQGFNDVYDMCENEKFSHLHSRGMNRHEEVADKYIEEIEGTCYKSSCSRSIVGQSINGFNEYELEIFEGRMAYLEDEE